MNLMVGPVFGELLYLQAGLHNPSVVKAVITLLPFANKLRFVCLSKSRVSETWRVFHQGQEASSKGAI